jgi:hypothetical protein
MGSNYHIYYLYLVLYSDFSEVPKVIVRIGIFELTFKPSRDHNHEWEC